MVYAQFSNLERVKRASFLEECHGLLAKTAPKFLDAALLFVFLMSP